MSNKILNEIKARLDDLTKPKGSLGQLESYAEKLAVIQGKVPPIIRRKATFVIAGDHGVTAQGVSLYPKAVTAQMLHNIIGGGAAINVLSKACNFDVYVVDAGVDGDFPNWPQKNSDGKPGFFNMKVVNGTKDFCKQPAFTQEEFEQCLENGKKLAEFSARESYDIVAIGDMGIGNTTSAAAVLVAYGFAPDLIIDRGTGIDDAMLENKKRLIVNAVKERGPYKDAKAIAMTFAGPEIATAAGLILGLKNKGIACMLDGFPITAAAVIAWKLDPSVTSYLFAGHQSKVKGHRPVLDAMGLAPVVSLDMRLGEGTGAVIGGFIVELGSKIAAEMARFSDVAVAKAESEEKNY